MTVARIRVTAMQVRGALGVAVLAAAALATGCSGGSSSSTLPRPTPAPTGAFVPVANASRGAMTLALGALKTAQYYATYIRPGARSSLAWYRLVATRKEGERTGRDQGAVPTPNPAPSCDPATQTALSSQATAHGQNYVVVIAYYPPGDTHCAQSPAAVSEMYYPDVPKPFSQGPQAGVGYYVSFAAGQLTEYDIVNTAIYAAAEGKANVDSEIDRYDASQAPTLTPPAAGMFPATFPLAFPLPSPPPLPPGDSFVSDFYATQESGTGTSRTGTATLVTTNPLFLPFASLGAQQNLGALDQIAVTVQPAGGGFAYSAVHDAPLYAFDVLPLALNDGGQFLGAGKTVWSYKPLTSGVSAANFGNVNGDAATYSASGAVTAQSVTFADTVNAVTVKLQQGAGSGSLTATDDLRKAPATSLNPIPLRAGGSTPRFNYRRDGSFGLVLVHSVAE